MTASDVWALRRARGATLMAAAPHAQEILAFYVGLVESQRETGERLTAGRWSEVVAGEEGEMPTLRVERLPIDELLPHFVTFVGAVMGIGTDAITEGGRWLLAAEGEARARVLRAALQVATTPRSKAGTDDLAPSEVMFHARAFLEGVLTTLVGSNRTTARGRSGPRCGVCGALPVVAALRDDADALGIRDLTCSLCASRWHFPRLTCAHCGETEGRALVVHTADAVDHVRVDECGTCGYYIKTVDLRRAGDAVPVVDDLATLELDLWARERGLTRIHPNVLGL